MIERLQTRWRQFLRCVVGHENGDNGTLYETGITKLLIVSHCSGELKIATADAIPDKTNIIEVCYTETPEYTLDNFLSDVGGTAGLILGNADG